VAEQWQGPVAPDPPKLGHDLEDAWLEPSDVQAGAAWSQARVTDTRLAGSRARAVGLEQVLIEGVDWSGSELPGLRLVDCELRGCNLANLVAAGGSMRRVSVSNGRLTGLQWTGGRIADVTFRDCRIDLAAFVECGLERVVFEGCLLGQADFQGARMRSVLFQSCDLSEADLTGARLGRCELRGCTLAGLRGIERLRGAAVPWADVVGMAGTLATALGIHVLDSD
jgi:uncharacterized protein YjbI with pentapeptide repeats